MIKKRTRPPPRAREPLPEDGEASVDESGDDQLPLADLIEVRRLRKARQGIDAAKLSKGDVVKRRKRVKEEEEDESQKGGLRTPAASSKEHEEEDEDEGKDAKARRAVRANNFTQQTNTLDVDKHMMAYIEENMKLRSKPDKDQEKQRNADPQDELFLIADRWKFGKKEGDEGNVSNSLTMLTAIPEVDLGIDTRLKNIEETEKAKRAVAEERKDRRTSKNDEEHLVATRFYRPNLRQKSDADILREAKMEALGMPVQDDAPRASNQQRVQMASDERVMERFKKRMRK